MQVVVEIVARVSSTCQITATRDRYSVPCHLAGHRVSMRVYLERIVVTAGQQTGPSIGAQWIAIRPSTTGCTTFR